MSKPIIAAQFLLLSLLFSRNAYAYIDPGTTSSVFAMLAPLLSMFLVFLGFLFRPFKRVFRFLIDKFRGGPADEQLASERLTGHPDGKDR